ncbi:hypothetical protein AURDEDRAFT_177568 [Auricularia subglabra TFB-10046 SS5]|uniref:BRCT domain-containing protein n=1 Tax=Auricularia subglabra (strain TFB-10046 / SS5) TaxID=717982 RepID=J0CSU0_AURST|nr:hypothetical protein AURDEDRAFT_177568 [Auricularia subglabra TFB-10046 SS5]
MPVSSPAQLQGRRVHLERTVYCLEGEDAQRSLLKESIQLMSGTLVDEMKDADYILVHPARIARDHAFDHAPGIMLSYRFVEDSFKSGRRRGLLKYLILRDPNNFVHVLRSAQQKDCDDLQQCCPLMLRPTMPAELQGHRFYIERTVYCDDEEDEQRSILKERIKSASGILVNEMMDADCIFIDPSRTILDKSFDRFRGLILSFHFIGDCYEEKKTLPVLNYAIVRDPTMWRLVMQPPKPQQAERGEPPVPELERSRDQRQAVTSLPKVGPKDYIRTITPLPRDDTLTISDDDESLDNGVGHRAGADDLPVATYHLSPELGAPPDEGEEENLPPEAVDDRSHILGGSHVEDSDFYAYELTAQTGSPPLPEFRLPGGKPLAGKDAQAWARSFVRWATMHFYAPDDEARIIHRVSFDMHSVIPWMYDSTFRRRVGTDSEFGTVIRTTVRIARVLADRYSVPKMSSADYLAALKTAGETYVQEFGTPVTTPPKSNTRAKRPASAGGRGSKRRR